jgi:hypothetical protein
MINNFTKAYTTSHLGIHRSLAQQSNREKYYGNSLRKKELRSTR